MQLNNFLLVHTSIFEIKAEIHKNMDAGEPNSGADSQEKDKTLPSLSPSANLVGKLED
jgi:hypothetical protein